MAWTHKELMSHSPKCSTNTVTWTMFSAAQQKKCGRFQNLHDANYQSVRLINSVLLTNVKTLDITMDIFPGMLCCLLKNVHFISKGNANSCTTVCINKCCITM
jgi:hypothetical protein